MVAYHVGELFSEDLLMFTDGSVDSNGNSAIAALVTSALCNECAGKPSIETTSTTAELAAVLYALR